MKNVRLVALIFAICLLLLAVSSCEMGIVVFGEIEITETGKFVDTVVTTSGEQLDTDNTQDSSNNTTREENTDGTISPEISTSSPENTEALISTTSAPEKTSKLTETTKAPVVTTKPAETTIPVESGYKALSTPNADMYTGNLIVVNANHEFVFPTSFADVIPLYSARPEVTFGGKTVMTFKVGGSELPSMKAEALIALNSLATDFVNDTKLTSLEIGTNDAWRSRETQAELYAKYPTSTPATGFSEHNTGLGVNFNIMDDKGGIYSIGSTENADCVKAYSWLSINAYKYGFVERFKASKKSITGVTDNYHFRYVGVGHAYYMSQNNLCLEEYIDLLHTYTYGGNHLCFNADGINYEIYYIAYNKNAKSTEVYVPTNASYTISGDNYSGFIVTISR